jgi:hypothetical protein
MSADGDALRPPLRSLPRPRTLITVVGRVCIDMLRSTRARREDLLGSWLPEPVVSATDTPDPEQQALIADSVGLALLVVL